jgi:hypothetical protein
VAVHPGCIDTDTFTAAYGIGGLPVVDGAGCRCTRCARAPNARADVALKDAVCDDFDLLVVGPQRTGGGAAASSAVAPTAPRAR